MHGSQASFRQEAETPKGNACEPTPSVSDATLVSGRVTGFWSIIVVNPSSFGNLINSGLAG